MTVNESIIKALAPFGDPVAPNIYTKGKSRYYTFNYDLVPARFADNGPLFYKALIQIHFVCPLNDNSIRRRRETIQAIVAGGFGWPEVVDASDRDTQHYVFETEIYTDEGTE